ncbi:helix-turn-helix transcriptional regulator, partial [bacterium]|nr:helix-turn-helix transcriptional regulator [bacterium]
MISADRLKQARLRARFTQQELAGRARLSVGTVSNLETGRIAVPH